MVNISTETQFTKGLRFEYPIEEMAHRYEKDLVIIGKKRFNPFKIYTQSKWRIDVQRSDMFPGEEPASLLRFSPVYGIVKSEEFLPDEYHVLNVYRGFVIKPVGTVDPQIMSKCVSVLDRMLGLLTRDNDAQMWWLKKFIAWTIQHPEIKQQSCPVIIGGQGIGKSRFGITLMKALFGDLAGQAEPSGLADDKFLITPFLGKLITFIDEVKLESAGAINAIKKLVRETSVSGQLKFEHQRDYQIPSRLILAANQTNIGLSPEDAADRALFFVLSWTAENKSMTDPEFQDWTYSLKPFYSEFMTMLESVAVKQHLMRYFMEVECTREELEDLTHSSRNDPSVVVSTMSKAREIAREIAADSRVLSGNDITAWFNLTHLRLAIQRVAGKQTRVEASSVMMEYERAGVIEQMSGGFFRFKWGYGRLLQKLSEAHNLVLHQRHPTGPGDFEVNRCHVYRQSAAVARRQRRAATAAVVLSMLATLSMSTTSEAHLLLDLALPLAQPQHRGYAKPSFAATPTSRPKSLEGSRFVPNREHGERAENKSKPPFILPDLTVIDWGIVDYYGMPVERIRAIAFLRALSNVP